MRERYSSPSTTFFIDEYLEDKLGLKKENSYIIHRTSNADYNNRVLLKNRICNCENMYNEMKKTLDYNTYNKFIDDLSNRSDDKTQIFQRGFTGLFYIIYLIKIIMMRWRFLFIRLGKMQQIMP